MGVRWAEVEKCGSTAEAVICPAFDVSWGQIHVLNGFIHSTFVELRAGLWLQTMSPLQTEIFLQWEEVEMWQPSLFMSTAQQSEQPGHQRGIQGDQ